jgi:ABC-type multidrug transport system ATPase subunit
MAGISMGIVRDNEEEEINLNDNNINSINGVVSSKSSNSINETSFNKFVNNEIENINNGGGFLTKIKGVKKVFWYCCKKNVVAVNNLYLGLELNEKIGLLGFNGSGKSVIFKMIVNELLSDSGDINIFGQNKSIIGYCPQENITFDYMTVKEIILFFSGLNKNKENAEDICNNFGLNKYLNTYYINLSGGNKRKLALAISLINNPSLLLLDEPSSKLDPISRNNIYKNIKTLTKNNQRYNIILSTSSPEEADTLCDRISWFKKGNFTFIGKLDELKNPFKSIYKLYVKYNNKLINNNNINNDLSLNFLNETIKNFNKFTEKSAANPEIKPHTEYLYNTINAIKDYVTNIELIKIEINNTYEFNLEIKEDKKESLYLKIIELKNNYQQLSEISIGTYTLDNILSLSK